MTADVLHAWRSLRAMPLVSLVVDRLAGDRHRREHGRLLLAADGAVEAAARRRDRVDASDASSRAPTNGVYVGTSWPDYRDLQERLRSFQWLIAFRMTPLNDRRRVPSGAGNGSARVRQLLLGARSPSCRRPAVCALTTWRCPAANRSSSSRTTTGRRDSAALRRQSDRRSASTANCSPSSAWRRSGFRGRRWVSRSTCGCRRRWLAW